MVERIFRGIIMSVTVKRVEGYELPSYFLMQGLACAFKVTAHDGKAHYVKTEEDAARLATRLHLEDKAANGAAS